MRDARPGAPAPTRAAAPGPNPAATRREARRPRWRMWPRWRRPDQPTREDRRLRMDRATWGSPDGIAEGLPTEESPQVLDCSLAHGHSSLLGRASQMRQQHHVFHAEELGCDLGLVLIDIETGSGDGPVSESIHQGRLVDDVTTCGIDEESAPAHAGQALPIHEMMRFRRGRAVERHEIRFFENLFRALPWFRA